MSQDLTPLQRSAQDNLKIITAAIYAAIIVIGALVLLPDYWYLWLIILGIGVWRIVVLMIPKPAYMCEKCGTIFHWKKSTTLRPKPSDLYADNTKVRCPKCSSTSVHKMKKDEI
jgi:DNA-directed RNA polymerase subunit RPC12/RpoP